MLLNDLHSWGVSVLAQNGLAFDLATSTGRLMCTIMAGIASFERDLIRERVKSGLAAVRAKGKKLSRQAGQRPSDKKATKVLEMAGKGLSYRLIGRKSRHEQKHGDGNHQAGTFIGGSLEKVLASLLNSATPADSLTLVCC